MKTAIRISLILFLFLSQHAIAQDCSALFKKAFQKMKKLPDAEGGLWIKYAVKVQMADGTIHADNIEVTMFNKRAKIVSNDFTIYQDTRTMVVIQPEASTIFMTSPADDAVRKSHLQNFVMLQDSLFKYIEMKNCVAESVKNAKETQSLKRVSFQFPSLIQDQFPMNSIVYWIEEETASVKRIQLDYKESDDQQIRSIAFEFLKLSDQYQASPFEGPAIARVLDAKSSLRSEYKNYSLIDNR